MAFLLSLALVATAPTSPDAAAACRDAIAYSNAHRGVSVLVLQRGTPICQGGNGADIDTPYELWSGTKSFVGIMAAAAVQDGMLALDEPVAETISEWRSDAAKRTTTIRQLLSMTSGQAGMIGRPPGYADAVAAQVTAPPGTRFQYGPSPMQVFGEVMRRKLLARGEPGDPVAYIKRRVLDPAGIVVAQWRSGTDGNALMPQGAVLSARQWARFGEFIRAGGKIDGRPVVDPATFAALFQGSKANAAYGLTWWLPRPTTARDVVTASSDLPTHSADVPADLVYAAGAGDQRLYVVPSLQLTVVRQASLDMRALATGQHSGWSDAAFLNLVFRLARK